MKAVRFHQYGDPDVLRYEDVDVPVPAAGQVRIKVAATSFNPVDAGIRSGGLQGPFPVALPHTPGIDVAGTIDAIGDEVGNLAIGDKVIGFLPMAGAGAAAEYVIAPAEVLTSAPSSVPLADAAALPSVGLTARQALFELGQLTAGQRVLVTGAGGAVGAYAVQLAKNAGAYVVATASPRSEDRVRAAGADEILDHTTTDIVAAVTEPVDLLLNLAPIDPEQFAKQATLVRNGGTVVNTTVWMQAPSDEARGIRGLNVFVRSDAGQLAELVAAVDQGEVRIDISRRIQLEDLPALHTEAANGGVSGKVVVLTPNA
ncbi:NADPH:quinone reductase [Kribbella sp. ALI-6-A]|uniref:NADP-dependent oxidoreductase n=1 Tax=Kribbella sp. ALI-6-A TaxID=1933817 RepID=UPI00097C0AD7|nr:NADP-dependent oxidoreductase [Kribbella sp. ALI-6-A]ONI77581.1 NADPH:quinone reductase [Kribbella sp. ALI-6-A]